MADSASNDQHDRAHDDDHVRADDDRRRLIHDIGTDANERYADVLDALANYDRGEYVDIHCVTCYDGTCHLKHGASDGFIRLRSCCGRFL